MSAYHVLYTVDLEPITALQMPERAMKVLREHGQVQLAVTERLSPLSCSESSSHAVKRVRVVQVWAERFKYRDADTLMLFTHDDESALLLRSAFLPGQQDSLQNERSKAFADGFMKALNLL